MCRSELKSDSRDRIWWITYSPLIWALHFLASYLTGAIFCAKMADAGGSAGEVQIAVMIYTAAALSLVAWVAAIGFGRHRSGDASVPHDAANRADQRRLIGYATFLLSVLSAVAIIFTALVFVFIGSCH